MFFIARKTVSFEILLTSFDDSFQPEGAQGQVFLQWWSSSFTFYRVSQQKLCRDESSKDLFSFVVNHRETVDTSSLFQHSNVQLNSHRTIDSSLGTFSLLQSVEIVRFVLNRLERDSSEEILFLRSAERRSFEQSSQIYFWVEPIFRLTKDRDRYIFSVCTVSHVIKTNQLCWGSFRWTFLCGSIDLEGKLHLQVKSMNLLLFSTRFSAALSDIGQSGDFHWRFVSEVG